MFKHQYSIQSLLNMDIEQNLYKRYIQEVKSPLQTFNLSHSTIDSGNNTFRSNRLYNSPEPIYSTISQFPQSSQLKQDRKRSVSRTRRNKIFENIPVIRKDANKPVQTPGCWLGCMDLLQSGSQRTILGQIPTTRSEEIRIKEYSPMENQLNQSELSSLYYENPNIPAYEVEFIEFLLKVTPKLYLRHQLSSHLFVNKAELLQSLLCELYKEEKSQTINNLFSAGSLQRVDKRLNSANLSQFINKLTMTSNKPINSYAQQQVISAVQKIVMILNEVQQDIRQYLLSDKRVQELELIYEEMTHNSTQSKSLCLMLYQYLNSKGVSCRQSNVQHLSYIWADMKYRPYGKEQFVNEIIKNDIILKQPTENSSEFERQLERLGYSRNN